MGSSSSIPIEAADKTSSKWPAPWFFSVLVLPQGIYLGFVTTVLPFFLGQASVPIDQIAATTSLLSLPWIIFFLWAPLVDAWLRRRTWLMIWGVVTAVLLALAVPCVNTSGLLWVRILGIFGAVSASMVLAACGGLMATTLSSARKSRAASWYEAGKLAASALGAAVLLRLAESMPRVSLGVLAGVFVAAPALAGLTIPERSPETGSVFKERLSAISRQLKSIFRSQRGRWGAVLVVSPIGTGAAITLLPVLAKSYGVGTSGVIWANGIGGGVLLALGALCGTLFPSKWNRGLTYVSAGAVNALAALTLLLNHQPEAYFVGSMLYFGTTGLCWARFAALVVELVGAEGLEASTRFSVLTALGNIPLAYMTWFDGLGSKYFGVHGLLWMDAGGNLLVLLAVGLALLFRVRSPLYSPEHN
jgi:MFS family permease